MILYHFTYKKNIESIKKRGIIKKSYYVYLTPKKDHCYEGMDVRITVNVPEEELRYYEGCEDWELVIARTITPKEIIIIEDYKIEEDRKEAKDENP